MLDARANEPLEGSLVRKTTRSPQRNTAKFASEDFTHRHRCVHNPPVPELSFAKNVRSLLKGCRSVLVVAAQDRFKSRKFPDILPEAAQATVVALAKDVSPGDMGATASSLNAAAPRKVAVGVLPNAGSRYNSAARAEAIRRVVAGASHAAEGKIGVLLVLEDESHVLSACNAVGRAFPRYNRKNSAPANRKVEVLAVDAKGEVLTASKVVRTTVQATRDSQELVDTPPTDLNPATYGKRIRELLKGLPRVKIKEIVGNALVKQGMMGIHSVGRAAEDAPRMVIATYTPPRGKGSGKHIALVGKGVTYDTGGLNLKISGNMSKMKCDMGGSAAVLGAFRVLAANSCPHKLSLLMCLAENAIGPGSYKPDDILLMHSGKTVEINNTDAEGRLLLADGVSYASRDLKADIVFDAATLTGAQMISTGLLHAAVVSNDEDLEKIVQAAGTISGDLAHPLPFAPEFFRSEFHSEVADMCNSVRNRMNAQSACAAQFVYAQMEDTDAKWVHIDLAGPAFPKMRATGFGVALISEAIRNI